MDLDACWKLIDRSRRGADGCQELCERLEAALSDLPPAEIIAFDRHVRELSAAAYTWPLWGAAYLANGGCSDDGFDYFRGWLIAQGRKRFEAALRDPESIARYAEFEECECEDLLYAAARAYESSTGQPLPQSDHVHPAEPRGSRWQEDDLERLFPTLAKKFLD